MTTNLKSLINQGAIVLDVRTASEFNAGHSETAINMPLDQLGSKLETLQKEATIITVCLSGMRSQVATSILKANGFSHIYDGGSWTNFK
ncbi:MAG: rhodanese-like domain-containing protein [Mangrovibacterium sp.]